MAQHSNIRRLAPLLPALAALAAPAGAQATELSSHGVRSHAFSRTSGPAPPPAQRSVRRSPARNAAAVAARKAGAPSSGASAVPGASRQPGRTSVFFGINGNGLFAIDNTAYNQGTPADTTGAIGPRDYVEAVNSKIAVFPRNSGFFPAATADLDTFIGAFGDFTGDPQMQYDPVSGHWFYAALDFSPSGVSFLAFGWSKKSNPRNVSTGWCRFGVPSDVNFDGLQPPGSFAEDFPKLGHDNRRVVIGTNVFDATTPAQPFLTARIWTYAKPSSFDRCNPPTVSFVGDPQPLPATTTPLETADGDPMGTPVPANTTDSSKKTYVLAADDAGAGTQHQLAVVSVGGNPASPSFFSLGNVDVTPYDVPGNVPQPSGGFPLDSLDATLTQTVAHADPDANGREAVWAQHTVAGPGGRSAVRWYEVLPTKCKVLPDCNGGALRQEGTLTDPAQYLFNAAISPTMTGNRAVIEYNAGNASTPVQIRAQSRRRTTPLGTMTGEITLHSSSDIDQDFSCDDPAGAPCRWGDYSGASPDPLNRRVVWGANQYNGPNLGPTDDAPRWRTRIFAIRSP